MNSLKDLVAQIFPEECIIDGTSYSEKGKRFSLRPSNNEEIVLLRIDNPHKKPCQYFRGINPKCDLLCICRINDLIFISFVELKGSDVEHAINQILNTVKAFCPRFNQNIYHFGCKKLPVSHEKKKIYGVIVSTQGLSLKQPEKKKLHNQGIYIKRFKSQEIDSWTCSQLLKRFNDLNTREH